MSTVDLNLTNLRCLECSDLPGFTRPHMYLTRLSSKVTSNRLLSQDKNGRYEYKHVPNLIDLTTSSKIGYIPHNITSLSALSFTGSITKLEDMNLKHLRILSLDVEPLSYLYRLTSLTSLNISSINPNHLKYIGTCTQLLHISILDHWTASKENEYLLVQYIYSLPKILTIKTTHNQSSGFLSYLWLELSLK